MNQISTVVVVLAEIVRGFVFRNKIAHFISKMREVFLKNVN